LRGFVDLVDKLTSNSEVCVRESVVHVVGRESIRTHAVRDRLRTFAARLSGDSRRSLRASDTGIRLIRPGRAGAPSGSPVSAVPMDWHICIGSIILYAADARARRKEAIGIKSFVRHL